LLLYITDTEALGGAEGYLHTLLTHADRSHFRLGLLLPDRPATRPLAEAARRAGALVEPLQHVHQQGLNLRAIGAVAAQLRRLRPEVVHFVLPAPRRCAEAVLAAALVRVPRRIATFQLVTPVPHFGALIGAVRALNRRVQYGALHHLVAVSFGNWRLLTDQYGVPRQRTLVIPNGVDTDTFQPQADDGAFRANWGIPRHAPLIGVVARLAHTKGQRLLIEALPQVWEHFPETHVVLAGQGPQAEELRTLATRLTRATQVHFVGQQQDVRALLTALDVFTLPSFVEGLPFAVLEAMAMERPVVASAVDGTVEAIEHARSGLLVPAGDPAALAAAINQLLGDRGLCARLGKAARARLQVAFNQRTMLERTFELYRSTAATDRSRSL
jgi:glycosyltransferase involved in cell wall biosynthesis